MINIYGRRDGEYKIIYTYHGEGKGTKSAVIDAIRCGANLSWAKLSGSDLSESDLSGANLSGANLSGSDLSGSNLSMSNLSESDLSESDLSGANLSGANLSESDLSGSDLTWANLSGANLSGAINVPDIPQTVITPSGEFEGWKKCKDGVIVRLLIPKKAARSNAAGRKCRAEYVKVLQVIGAKKGVSLYDEKTVYTKGKIVKCDKWDTNRWNECGGGIHFFITKKEAEEYEC